MKKSKAAMETKSCGNCGRTADEGQTFNHCARCKVVAYCCRACQVHHWKNGHKDTCQDANEKEEEFVAQKLAAEIGKADEPSKPLGKPREPRRISSGGAAAEEEKDQEKKSPHGVGATRVDAEGQELSFGEDEDCAICTDRLMNPVRLPCGHWYCKECIEGVRQRKSLPDSCPVCREPLPPGADQLFDEAIQKYMKVRRAVERGGGDGRSCRGRCRRRWMRFMSCG